MVKLTREEVGWVHEMVLAVWMGMVEDPRKEEVAAQRRESLRERTELRGGIAPVGN